MKDNYLWDRSGEADPEVQKLEEILGTLRFQPRPLEIPDNIQPGQRRRLFSVMAIAAAIALFAFALGLWVNFDRRHANQTFEARRDSQIDRNANIPQPQVSPDHRPSEGVAVRGSKLTGSQQHRESARNLLAGNKTRGTRTQNRQLELTPRQLAEKEQVLIALRLASAKLNLAQRKAQGAPQLNTIRNQHKIG